MPLKLFGLNVGIPHRDELLFSLNASKEEKELMSWVNQARLHPEQFPPHGNTANALMKACPQPFRVSWTLCLLANKHSAYLATLTKDECTRDPHQNPDGTRSGDNGGPIDQKGFHTWHAENVATGQNTAELAVRFWMQDDEKWNWGHRNTILRPETEEAGVGYFNGGPWVHYWTLDAGTR